MKYGCVLFFLTCCFVLTGCSSAATKVELTSSSKASEDAFILELTSIAKQYKEHEKDSITAHLKYTGPDNEVRISHGGFSPIEFSVKELKKNKDIGGVSQTILSSTTLKKDEWLEVPFSKSGEITKDEFIKEYFNKDGFPKGKYEITATTDFEVEQTVANVKLKTVIVIEVD